MSTLVVPRAHAAAITGLEILNAHSSNHVSIATTGLDQQLRIWNLHIDSTKPGVHGVSVEKAGRHFTAVADISELAVLDHHPGGTEIIICGVGLDVWRHHCVNEDNST